MRSLHRAQATDMGNESLDLVSGQREIRHRGWRPASQGDELENPLRTNRTHTFRMTT